MKQEGDKKSDDLKLVVSGDSSHTLYVPSLNEHYHSTFGAMTESMHIFVKEGFDFVAGRFSSVNVLEVGFGTGLNALLILFRAGQAGIRIHYTGIEPYPLDEEILKSLNYRNLSNDNNFSELWESIHYKASWGSEYILPDGSTLLKWKGRVEDFCSESEVFNLVCFDAFAPDIDPGLWDESVFRRIAGFVARGGVLVTYSSKGSVRRGLKNAGFGVGKIPGPPGKREMVRAIKV